MSKQKLYLVYATVTGSKYLGTFKASSYRYVINAQENAKTQNYQNLQQK